MRWRNARGQTTSEFLMIVGLITAISIIVLSLAHPAFRKAFRSVSECVLGDVCEGQSDGRGFGGAPTSTNVPTASGTGIGNSLQPGGTAGRGSAGPGTDPIAAVVDIPLGSRTVASGVAHTISGERTRTTYDRRAVASVERGYDIRTGQLVEQTESIAVRNRAGEFTQTTSRTGDGSSVATETSVYEPGPEVSAGITLYSAEEGTGTAAWSGSSEAALGSAAVTGKVDLLSATAQGGVAVSIDENGIKGAVSGEAGVYVASASGTLASSVALGAVPLDASVTGSAYAGAEASAEAAVAFGASGAEIGFSGDVFAGAKAEVKGAISTTVAGVDATVAGSAGVSYGVGATADLAFRFKGGRLYVRQELGLTVGVGVSESVSFEVDVAAAGRVAVEAGKNAINWGANQFKKLGRG